MKKMSSSIFLSVFSVCFIVLTLAILIFVFGFDMQVETGKIIWALLGLIAVSICLSVFIEKVCAKRIAKEINDIDVLSDGEIDTYLELKPFSENIKTGREKLRKRMARAKREHKIQDKIRREFTANVSHELKTPLTSISGYAEIMKNGMVKEEDVARFSDKIYGEAQRLISLVGDIIKLSRLDENVIEEKKERIELFALCETIISSLESAAQKRNITFSLNGGKSEILGIPRIVEEMIYNLCDNAIKYNSENGEVIVSVMQTATEVVLSVSDTGIGIEKEETDRVFERFYRVNKSHSREIGGTGLGLSIVKHGAAVHNAKISVDSQVGKGSTFTITFSA